MPRVRTVVAGLIVTLALAGAGGVASRAENGVEFRDPLNDDPLDIELPADASEAARTFFENGENPYQGDEQAVAEGRQLYDRWCASCHMPDGSGRLGPNLIDGTWRYERAQTPIGQFEVIHTGATGAMQPFGDRLSPDEILKIIAYINDLPEQHQ